MIAYLIKRILAMIPTLIGITFITFLMINLAPGDPVAAQFGGGAEKSTEGGGGGDQSRQNDTIKAKKKLLGMLREDYALHAWGGAVALDLEEGSGAAPLEEGPAVEGLGRWARALARSADGQRLYAGGDGGFIVAVDPAGGAVASTFAGHTVPVSALAVSPDGQRLASADSSGVVKLWDLGTGAELQSAEALSLPIRDLAWLPDGRLLVAADDGVVRLEDGSSLAVLRTFEGAIGGVYALAVAPGGARFWAGGADRVLREWDPSSGQLTQERKDHRQAIHDLALSPDGALLATASEDRAVRVIELARPDAPARELGLHYKGVLAVTFAADGQSVYSGGIDESVRQWSVAEAKELGRSAKGTGVVRALVARDGQVWSAADSWTPVPIPLRYLKWVGRMARLDFDRSFSDDRLVMDKIKEAIPVTMGLNLLTILIIYAVSVPLGIFAAVRRGSWFDHVSSFLLFLLYSVPNFWLATLLILTFSSKTNWDILPSVGLSGDHPENLSYLSYLWDRITHLVLPISVMVYGGFASLSRYTRTSLLETIQQDYVRTARAKGLSETVVVLKHAFRNSLITIVTLIGNLLPALIGGSVIVEYIFSIDGMGRLGFDAILSRDYPVIMATTTMSAVLTLFGILLSDILYTLVDPRVSHDN